MKVLLIVFAVAFVSHTSAKSIGEKPEKTGEIPFNEELVVESTLTVVKKKETSPREKRQFGHRQFGGQPQYGQSSALANANAFNQYQGPGGFGGSAANAGAQAFQSQALGGFGASAANSQTQAFNAGPGGIQGSAGLSGSQTYNLPNGHNINLAYGGTYSANNGAGTAGNSHSLTYT